VCVVGATASRLARASKLGAERVWDITERGTDGLVALLEETGGPPSVVIEAAGTPSAVALSIKLVASGGRVVLLGLSGNRVSELRADDIVLRQLTVQGSLSSEPEDWEAAAEMLAGGAVQSIVTHRLRGLSEYGEAIRLVKSPPQGMLKLQLLLGEDGNLQAADDAAVDQSPHGKRARIDQ